MFKSKKENENASILILGVLPILLFAVGISYLTILGIKFVCSLFGFDVSLSEFFVLIG